MTYAFRVLAFFICEYGRRKSQHYFNKAGGVVSLTVFFFFETWLASKYFGDLRHEMKWDI